MWVMSMSYLIKWGVSFFCNFEDFIVPKKIKPEWLLFWMILGHILCDQD